ncbi:hypothetical protein [Helicobacter sp. T3_23-1056]
MPYLSIREISKNTKYLIHKCLICPQNLATAKHHIYAIKASTAKHHILPHKIT